VPYDESREGEHARKDTRYLTGDRLLFSVGIAGAFALVSSAVSHATEEDQEQAPSLVIPESSTAALISSTATSLETSTALSSALSSSLSQVTQLALAVSDSSVVVSAITETATATVSQLNTAISEADSATALASSAIALAQAESLTVTQLQSEIETQTALVSSLQLVANSANAAFANASSTTTYIETFTNNTITTPLLITSDGMTVTTTPTNNTYIGGNWSTQGNVVSGPGLVLMSPTQDVTLDFTPQGNVVSVSFGVYAKNGDVTATANLASGNTITETIQDNVSNNYPGFVHVETITVTSGESIDTLTLPSDWDYYIIDNISFTVSSSDPELEQAASQATANLVSSQQALSYLVEAESAVTTMIETLNSVDSSTATAQLAVADAQVSVSQLALTILQEDLSHTANVASTLTPTSYVTLALDNAQVAIDDANVATSAAADKKNEADTFQLAAGLSTTVDSATALVETRSQELVTAQTNVDAQQDVVDEAQAVVDANTQPGLKVEVYDVLGQNSSPILPENAEPVHTTFDTDGIDESWGLGNVAGSNLAEDVIVRYSGTWTPTYTGTQYITASADDGVKLYLDDELVINDWYDKGGGGSTADVETTANTSKKFELWYYENGGGAVLQLLRFTGQGWEIIPGSEFTFNSATEEQLLNLASATETLESLELIESTKESELSSAQATLVLAQSAENSRGEYLELAQVAIDKTEIALTLTNVAETVVQAEVTRQTTPVNPPAPAPAPEPQPQPQPQPDPTPTPGSNEPSPTDPLPEIPETPTEPEEPVEPEPDLEEPTEPESPLDDSNPEEDDSTSEESDFPSEEEPVEDGQEQSEPDQEEQEEPLPQTPQEPRPTKPVQEENVSSDDNTLQPEEVKNLVKDLAADGKLTAEEKKVIAAALVSAFVKSTGSVPASALADAGLRAKDLPPETPLQLDNGVVIQAQVQAAFEVLADPGELLGALLKNPAQVLMALTNLGADMSPEEREESQKVVVASVIVTGVAIQAAAAAAAGAASSSSGGGAPVSRESGTTRRRGAGKSGKIRRTSNRRTTK